ncbi:Polyketide cyclase / dehydrase and lipid transport [Actinopolyspora xinjiangensis]|uniref:Polyketide cyclase / dehydrase and lipid transport n=1 Tax=Actinopolyspora xinjiangensis TaxID=405564 RepID=A0A1H0VDF0_9ACTN|nr:SRPBCC family protein [Actinopolyspora xinjiangensis]SDP76255.1 Polyketide cyclase / dehydrase and lipid transport [Actinopolyspora xinjiangensis]
MTESDTHTGFELHAAVHVHADPHTVYDTVSDITRMGEWSPENTGGEWLTGTPGRPGSRFHGHNRMEELTWTTECEIVEAEPGSRFSWAVLTGAPDVTASVWSFEMSPGEDGGTELVQRYRLNTLPTGFRQALERLPDEEAAELMRQRREQLRDALHRTVRGIKETLENS